MSSSGAILPPGEPGGPECLQELAAARAGSRQRLGALLEPFRPYLRAIARQEVNASLAGKVAASDLVQETLVRGVEGFATFEGANRQQLAGWLRQILLNQARNAARTFETGKRDVAREEPGGSGAFVAGDLSPSRAFMAREREALLGQALTRLPAGLRALVEWRHRENLSFAEIARRIGKSEDKARRLWAQAIAQLQRELQTDESSTR
jgi:RNA polymerase sigma-70 factor (ECF subfamily)